jgi:hypothetical protein
MTDEQRRLEALKLAVQYCAKRDVGSTTEMLWLTKQFYKFLQGETDEHPN